MSTTRIRTLIVDDSVFMRTVLKSALGRSSSLEIVGSAQNGIEALEKIKQLKPDVVTLDVEMPGLDGIGVLRRVMAECPLPVVMVSTKTQAGAKLTFEALEIGAVDYVAKPLGDKGASLEGFQEKVIRAVETAFASNRARLGHAGATKVLRPRAAGIHTDGYVVAIGISAGGPATLHKLIPCLPKVFPPVVLTQHMPADFTGPFAQRLNGSCELEVKEAADGDELICGRLLLAPGDRHMKVVRKGQGFRIALDDGPKVAGFRPSVDVLFQSVATTHAAKAVGLVMTGMGCDGAEGITAMKRAGAKTLAQDQASCVVYGMPKAAAETGCVDKVVSLAEIPDALVRALAAEQPVHA